MLSEKHHDFFAGDTAIEIIPAFSLESLPLISKSYGPFFPNVPITIPLWIAIYLRKRAKCKIITPPWMTLANLKLMHGAEKNNTIFRPVPWNFIPVSFLLLRYAAIDIPDAALIQHFLTELIQLRETKIDRTLRTVGPDFSVIKVTNLSHFEIERIRSTLIPAMNRFDKLRKVGQKAKEDRGLSADIYEQKEFSQLNKTNSRSARAFYGSQVPIRRTDSRRTTREVETREVPIGLAIPSTGGEFPSEAAPDFLHEESLDDLFELGGSESVTSPTIPPESRSISTFTDTSTTPGVGGSSLLESQDSLLDGGFKTGSESLGLDTEVDLSNIDIENMIALGDSDMTSVISGHPTDGQVTTEVLSSGWTDETKSSDSVPLLTTLETLPKSKTTEFTLISSDDEEN